jgi:hypothetical protein
VVTVRIALVLVVLVCAVTVAVVVLAIVPGDDEESAAASVDEIVNIPPLWYRKSVAVTGPADPLADGRFVLQGDNRMLIVQPQPDAVEGVVEPGERVTVRGSVFRLNRLQAAELGELRREGRGTQLADTPTALGDPYISANHVDAGG